MIDRGLIDRATRDAGTVLGLGIAATTRPR